ncbi:MAG: molybdopterin cofactor-binding domain-containing protein [Acidobacteriota bacterium]
MEQIIKIKVNGLQRIVAVKPDTTLLQLLRNHLGFTGTKRGCEIGDCGACTVLMDGKPVASCILLAMEADGKEITTIEGLAENGKLHPLQRAFVEHGAIQCGYCTPGMILSAKALIDKKPDPSEDEIKGALGGNLCRCTGYVKIVEAVKHYKDFLGEGKNDFKGEAECKTDSEEEVKAGSAEEIGKKIEKRCDFTGEWKSTIEFSIVGKGIPRKDAPDKATGAAKFTGDIQLPGMLYGKILTSPLPHARIKSINTENAKSLSGVKAVITAKDVPDVPYGVSPARYDEHIFAIGRVLYAGDRVAAVCAVDEETAEKALASIEVYYEELPAVFDPFEAMKDGAPQLHERYRNNINTEIHHNFGDVEKAFQAADLVREDTFVGNRTMQSPLEPHAALAQWDSGENLTVWSSTQTPHYVQYQLHRVLGLPMAKIRVIKPHVGGGFGGKAEVTALEFCAAILSKMTGKPVQMLFDRKEAFLHGRGRHRQYITLKTGFRKDGTILGVHSKTYLDGGAYTGYGIIAAYYSGAMLPVPYKFDNFKFDGYRVCTNLPPCGAQRGHGCPQPRFAFESQLDMIAKQLGMDPIELRMKNARGPNERTPSEFIIHTNEFKACLKKVREMSDWDAKRGKLPPGRGIGIAGGGFVSGSAYPIYRSTFPHSNAMIRLSEDGTSAILYIGAADIGQGSDTVLAQIAAEELGLLFDDIQVISADTRITPIDLGSYSSRTTLMAGNAVKEAAQEVKKKVLKIAAEMLETSPENLIARKRRIFSKDDPEKCIFFEKAAAEAFNRMGPIAGMGHYQPPKLGGTYKGASVGTSPTYSFCAMAVEVSVDMETGKVSVTDFYCAHDSGTVINPLSFDGQVEGSCVMGLGETLLEEVVFDKGVILNPNMRDYILPSIMEMPRIHSASVGVPDPMGPYGAKEVGEGSSIAVSGAIANAIFDAIGVQMKELPITPDKILAAIKKIGRGSCRE